MNANLGNFKIYSIFNFNYIGLTMKKQCIDCGEEFRGRADAKFCSDQCRSSYHNRAGMVVTDVVKKVNAALRKNRRILQKLNPEGKARVSRKDLVKEGFNFDYHTNIYHTKSGKSYTFVYDYGYIDTGQDWFTLVVKQEYV